MSDLPARNGGQILVDALQLHAVDTLYCIPGESYLPVLDALHDASGIQTIVTRHEGAASNMADAYGKLTGRPGICFVTRGPGATHAANGVHTAMQDSTPMILFIGQVESAFKGREAFQEVDYRQMFGGLAKWATEVDDIRRIPEIVTRAFRVAQSGRPGPVVIGLPEEVLFGSAQVADVAPSPITRAAPTSNALAELRERLSQARRPLLIVGGTGWTTEACEQVRAFARANRLPLVASFRRQDLIDNRDEQYAGQLGFGASPRLTARVQEADLLLVLGSRLSETPSAGYTLIQSPRLQQSMIHVYADASELGRVYQADQMIEAAMPEIATALAGLAPLSETPWAEWTAAARADYLSYVTPPEQAEPPQGVDLTQVINYLNEALPDDAVISNGAGNYAVWVHRFYRYRTPRSQLAPTNGAMGYGFPAAIAAKLRDPQRSVVCFAGDGCFMMYPQELATAVQYGAALTVIVVNNGMLGTIRMHQEREYPGRISATQLRNPDFVALARAFGAHGELVERTEDFAAAFERAQASGKPALIELRTDPQQITPVSRLP
ncbi:thiamine pyrophosphate-binding protein [Pseudomonas nitroreducens]|uniref:thiamine pyrophosphate-binding protein n=1 Tax=Pseudomonas TaxID=286 RepID=UPI0007EE3FD0|nr:MULTISPECIES: thiamine pyrophosphate-binding protein [Pseudomonas]MDG9853308.1 thiamine pyrophosphate-binding protein [Pseudomonas nitroreducens]MDH1075342.1 thiamine pyrophosphate-binding protein [Pseudomonas nitroreducens]NMZ75306.1 thiamine pyrophosphate-binding protein [Pseudomonas nitroreducens]OBY59348.1 thiamine pyrophosphate-binding protein [Pseudomonas sp. AU12215]